MSRASSRVEAGTSGFLSISDINLGVSVEFEQGSQASSCVEAWNSACLSSCEWGVRPLVELDLEPAAFSGGCTWGVSAPLCCDLIVGVPLELVQGHQALSRVNGEISVFGIVAQPTKVPVKFQCETGHFLRCDRNVGIPFQSKGIDPYLEMRRGKWAQIEVCRETQCSSRVRTGKSGNFWSFMKGVEYLFEFQEGTWDFS